MRKFGLGVLLVAFIAVMGPARAEAGTWLGIRGGVEAPIERAVLGESVRSLFAMPAGFEVNLSLLFDTSDWNRLGVEVDLRFGDVVEVGVYATSVFDMASGPFVFGFLLKGGGLAVHGQELLWGVSGQVGLIVGFQMKLSQSTRLEFGGDLSYQLGLLFGEAPIMTHSFPLRLYAALRF